MATYTITWKDGDGRILKKDRVTENTLPRYVGDEPLKSSTDQYIYKFNNTWLPTIVRATEDATYTAQFDDIRKFFLEINGTNIAPYIAQKGLKWTRNDIDSAKAGRNLQGTMNRGRVVTKVKLEVKCAPLNQDQARMILNLIYPEYVTVHYIDPRLGERNVQFYSNNVPSTFNSQATDGSLLWDEISFPLVER